MLSFLDIDGDCTLSVDEVRTTLGELLTYDIDLDGNGITDAASIGVGLRAVRASFAPPGP